MLGGHVDIYRHPSEFDSMAYAITSFRSRYGDTFTTALSSRQYGVSLGDPPRGARIFFTLQMAAESKIDIVGGLAATAAITLTCICWLLLGVLHPLHRDTVLR